LTSNGETAGRGGLLLQRDMSVENKPSLMGREDLCFAAKTFLEWRHRDDRAMTIADPVRFVAQSCCTNPGQKEFFSLAKQRNSD